MSWFQDELDEKISDSLHSIIKQMSTKDNAWRLLSEENEDLIHDVKELGKQIQSHRSEIQNLRAELAALRGRRWVESRYESPEEIRAKNIEETTQLIQQLTKQSGETL